NYKQLPSNLFIKQPHHCQLSPPQLLFYLVSSPPYASHFLDFLFLYRHKMHFRQNPNVKLQQKEHHLLTKQMTTRQEHITNPYTPSVNGSLQMYSPTKSIRTS